MSGGIQGVSADADRATAVEPVPVSPLRDGIADAVDEHWFDYDDECGECWNCGGDGFVYGCSWDWQCDTWDGDSCLCTRPCHICHPPKPDPALQAVLRDALAAPEPTK